MEKTSTKIAYFVALGVFIVLLVILVQGLPTRGWQIGVCAVTLALLALMAHRNKS